MQASADLDFDALFNLSSAQAAHEASLEAARPSHYKTDCLYVADRAQADPDLFPGIVAFVLLTIQQHFIGIPRAVADVAKHGTRSRFMFGSKPDGLTYARQNKRILHKAARACHAGNLDLAGLVQEYMGIPGLGIVKASFLAQLTVGQGACLDTVNMQRLGLAWNMFATSKARLSPSAIRARILSYQAVCNAHGTTQEFWDIWCDTLAARQEIPTGKFSKIDGMPIYRRIEAFKSGEAASAVHRLAVDGGIY